VETNGGQGSRKLTFTDKEGRCEFVALKPADVPVYVESGAVDAGIVGSDVLRGGNSEPILKFLTSTIADGHTGELHHGVVNSPTGRETPDARRPSQAGAPHLG
jgi:hypothetical protein